ncbi:MAG: DUF4398 domain-containing protein [Myxococcota bacterium]
MHVRFPTSLLLLLLGAACSPINATREISAAQSALTAAKDAGANRLAVYEYTSATEYLHKAREEANYSDYDAARIYAAHARELAQEARARADRERGAVPAENAHEMDPVPPPPDSQTPPESSTSASVDDASASDQQKKARGRAK